jgi:hypothetical protein
MRSVRRAAMGAAVPFALLAVGCGAAGNGGPGSTSQTLTPGSAAPATSTAQTTLDFTVNATGSDPAGGTFSYSLGDATSCSAWVAGGQAFLLELPQVSMSSGMGFELVVGVPATDYGGPGTYTIDHTGALQAVYLGPHEFALHGATLSVKADGSGAIDFSNEPDPLGNVDSGTVSWTCS